VHAQGSVVLHLLPFRRVGAAHAGGDQSRGSSRSRTRRCMPALGDLPLLTPMSEVAGRMAVQEGRKYLGEGVRRQRDTARGGGGGVPGVLRRKVRITRRRSGRCKRRRRWRRIGAASPCSTCPVDRLALSGRCASRECRSALLQSYNLLEHLSRAERGSAPCCCRGPRRPKLGAARRSQAHEAGLGDVDVAVIRAAASRRSSPRRNRNPVTCGCASFTMAWPNMPGGCRAPRRSGSRNATFPYAKRLARRGWSRPAKRRPGACVLAST